MLAQKLQTMDDGQLTRLERLLESSGVAELMLAVDDEQKRLRAHNEEQPMICDSDISKDFRYKAGRLSVLRELQGLPTKAKEMQRERNGEST